MEESKINIGDNQLKNFHNHWTFSLFSLALALIITFLFFGSSLMVVLLIHQRRMKNYVFAGGGAIN